MKLELEENEVVGIINILGELPTKSNAWPLAQKITYQYEQQKETAPQEPPHEEMQSFMD